MKSQSTTLTHDRTLRLLAQRMAERCQTSISGDEHARLVRAWGSWGQALLSGNTFRRDHAQGEVNSILRAMGIRICRAALEAAKDFDVPEDQIGDIAAAATWLLGGCDRGFTMEESNDLLTIFS
jgi:hypothetical protein